MTYTIDKALKVSLTHNVKISLIIMTYTIDKALKVSLTHNVKISETLTW